MIATLTPVSSPVLVTDAAKPGSKLWMNTKKLTLTGTSKPALSLAQNFGPCQLFMRPHHMLAMSWEAVMNCIGTGWSRTIKSLEQTS